MRIKALKLGIFSVILVVLQNLQAQKITYPVTAKKEKKDNYFGTSVEDPYYWLEDDNAPETKAWVEAQNKVTFEYLQKLPHREKLRQRISDLWNYERFSPPQKEGPYFIYFKNSGMQNQDVLYINELGGKEKVLLDPNTLSRDGTTSIGTISFSNDHRFMAYTTSVGGSDWNEIRVLTLPEGKILEDKIEWVKFSSIAWYKDGFFYSRYDEPKGGIYSKVNENQKVFYHKIGTDPKTDPLIYQNPEFPKRTFGVMVTPDEEVLVISEAQSTSGNALHCIKLNDPNRQLHTLVSEFEHDFDVLDHVSGNIILLTNYKAPNYQILQINLMQPQPQYWKTLIPEAPQVIQSAHLAGKKFVLKYLKDAVSQLKIYDYSGTFEREVSFPIPGTVGTISSKKDEQMILFSFSSFVYPSVIYQYDVLNNQMAEFFKPKLKYNPDDFVSKQVFYYSKDGTKVPMFIVHKKGLTLNGKNPTFLYGYGGFNISLTPHFTPDRIAFLENGGVYAQPSIRGGGEYGEEWHKAGTQERKQNVFDDFIAAAEYLIREKYTSPDHLAIHGRSNGGLLVGACMTQRPELFKVALPGVGVLDMLKFHKFTIGWAWVTDYGSSDTPEGFKYLYKYSPYHNLKKTKYPATLITTADHDDRVVPAHSFKFTARLQEMQQADLPTLIRIDVMAGHGAGKPTSKRIEEWADIWAFVFFHTGIK